jgi:hypothetical protein
MSVLLRETSDDSGPAFDAAVGDFAAAYADQNERDHRSLLDAVVSGRIRAESGV